MAKSLLLFVGILLFAGVTFAQRGGGRFRQMMMMREREFALRRAFPFGLPRQLRGPLPPGVAGRMAMFQRQRMGLNPFLGSLSGLAGNPFLGNPFATGINSQLGLAMNTPGGLNRFDLSSLSMGNGLNGDEITLGTTGLQNPMATGVFPGLQTSFTTEGQAGFTGQNGMTAGGFRGFPNAFVTQGQAGFPGTTADTIGQQNGISTSGTGQQNSLPAGNTGMLGQGNMMMGQQGNQGFPQVPAIPTIPAIPNQGMTSGIQNGNSMANQGMTSVNTQLFTSSNGNSNSPFSSSAGFSSQAASPNAIVPSQVAQGPTFRQQGPRFSGPMQFPTEQQLPQTPFNPNGQEVMFPSGIQRFGPNEQRRMQTENSQGRFQNAGFQQSGNMFPTFPSQTNDGMFQPGQSSENQQPQFGNQRFGFGPVFNTPGVGQSDNQNVDLQFQPLPNNQQFQVPFGQNQIQNQFNTGITNDLNANAFNTRFGNSNNQQGNDGTIRIDSSNQNAGSSAGFDQTIQTQDGQIPTSESEFNLVEVGNVLDRTGLAQVDETIADVNGGNFKPIGDINAAFEAFPAGTVQDLTLPTAPSQPQNVLDTTTAVPKAEVVKTDALSKVPSPLTLKQDFSFFVPEEIKPAKPQYSVNDLLDGFFDHASHPDHVVVSETGSKTVTFPVEGLPKDQTSGNNTDGFSFLTSSGSATAKEQGKTVVMTSGNDQPSLDTFIPPLEASSARP